jgi:hypothetical protein
MDALRRKIPDDREAVHEAILADWKALPPGPPGDMSRK